MLFNKIIYLDILLIYIWMHVNIIIGKINYQLLKNLLSSSFLKFWNIFISRALPYNDDHDKFQVAEVLVRKQGVVYDIVAAINIFRSLIVCAVFDVHMLSSFQCDTINNTSICMCVCVCSRASCQQPERTLTAECRSYSHVDWWLPADVKKLKIFLIF